MNVVIFGAHLRNEQGDHELVNSLIDGLKAMYPGLFIITGACDRGVGKIVTNRLRGGRSESEQPEVPFCDINYKIFGKGLPKSFYYKVYRTRNRALSEIGEEFHIFLDKESRNIALDLLEEVRAAGLPHSVYYPGENSGPKLLK